MLLNRDDLNAARAHYKSALDLLKKKILVCAGTGCVAGGSLEIYAELVRLIEQKGIACAVSLEKEPHEDSVGVKKSGCHGFCEMGPLVRIEPMGWLYIKVKLEDCMEIIEQSIVGNKVIDRLAYHKDGQQYSTQEEIPFYKKQTRLVLEHCGHIDATSLQEYLAIGGYKAFETALFDMSPEEIVKVIEESNLRGRGGGGYPAGRKWSQVKRQKSEVKFVVCNGDEGDPGAFMDRSVMEGDPHRMLEGMMIAGIACGAAYGYIYVRAEYPLAINRLETAIAQNRAFGLLGDNILGLGHSFDIKISKGAGAFVCGEGSALTTSIEGKRGMPRVKPPRTVEQGLYGKPTVLNNVETFANVPLIINEAQPGTNRSDRKKALAPKPLL